VKILYPEVFWFLLPLAFLLVPAVLNYRKGKRSLILLSGDWRQEESLKAYFIKSSVHWITIFLFFILSILALAGISWGKTTVKDENTGFDLVVAADISRSMLASDVSPSRLALAGEGISSILNSFDSVRTALVIFKGKGEILVPLTEDGFQMESALRNLSPNLYTASGSDIEWGVRSAIEAFPPGSPGKKAILLVSDGESLNGNPRNAAREAYLRKIPLFVLGTGSVEGVILTDESGDVIQDENGQPVVSRLEESVLREMADLTGGGYYNLSDPRSVGEAIAAIRKLIAVEEEEGIVYQDQLQFRGFLLLALFFLMLNLFLSGIRWSKWF
jgi:Ca-activated chloride channel homolog